MKRKVKTAKRKTSVPKTTIKKAVAKVTTKQSNLSADTLKTVLWDTLHSIKSDTMDVKKANAITNNARAICGVVKLELELLKMNNNKKQSRINKF